MKKIILLCLSMLLLTFYGCKEEDVTILKTHLYQVKIWLKEFLTTKVPTVF